MRKHRATYDPSYLRYLEKHPEAAKNEPTGHVTTWGSPENTSTKWYATEKQYGDVGSGIGVSPANKVPWESHSGTYPPNPTPMQGAGDRPGSGAIVPKLQAQGYPELTYGVRHDDSMDRTIVGDKRQYNENPQVWRDGGRDFIRNIQDHTELLDTALGSRGFVRNDQADFGGTRRYEHKMSGDYAEIVPRANGQKVNLYDRTQRLLGSADTFSGIDGLLGERYEASS